MKNKVTTCESKLADLNLEPLQNAEEVKGGTLGLLFYLFSYKSYGYSSKSYGSSYSSYGSKGYSSKKSYYKDKD